MEIQFEEVIATRERLRELSKQPSQRASNKIIDHIDEICRRFIAACPFVMVASRGADGRIELSPKGDPPGFVAVLDSKTLAIPDRPGNHRLDTFESARASGGWTDLRDPGQRRPRCVSAATRGLCVTAPCRSAWRSMAKPRTSPLSSPSRKPSCTAPNASCDLGCGCQSIGPIVRQYPRSPRQSWRTKAPGRRHASAGHHR